MPIAQRFIAGSIAEKILVPPCGTDDIPAVVPQTGTLLEGDFHPAMKSLGYWHCVLADTRAGHAHQRALSSTSRFPRSAPF